MTGTTTGPATGPPLASLDVSGPAAPPRTNGELVFAAPWEGRAFGMAMSLAAAGVIGWDGFRERLIARIAAAGEPFSYYACWLAALEDVLVGTGRLDDDDVAGRTGRLARRPAGHDHDRPEPAGDLR